MKALPIRRGIFVTDKNGNQALKGTRCAHCNEVFFPPRQVCPRCHCCNTLAEVALSRTGTVHATTEVIRYPAHLKQSYVLAEVDLPEGVRLRAQLGGGDAATLRPGDQVELVVEPLFNTAEDQAVLGYRFHRMRAAP